MKYPDNDEDFEDRAITAVRDDSFETNGAWWLGIPTDSPVKPMVGMSARFYPGGIGYPVRGLFIDGVKIWYRTPEEQKEHQEIELYGADAAEWLKRWDEGRSVWTISMGGLGPGYEQCIHITAAEILRHFLAEKYDADLWKDSDIWRQVRDTADKVLFATPAINDLGLSGAQAGAAYSIACVLYKRGPRSIMNDRDVKDRHIQVSRKFPQAA